MKENNQLEDIVGKAGNRSSKTVAKYAVVIGNVIPVFIPSEELCPVGRINLLFDFCTFNISHVFRNQLCMKVGVCVNTVIGKQKIT